ncbi:hypothetical protein [Paenibacillus wynnii]|uniref:hypothetical protein n=1 Tax=Paenibacillus wynnii TaxID=268407 RepID=UPI0027934DE5|nr:hypothetical protein [Paenibacillus wynnii]MDQ0192415.1 hypothetical protein [Paenibacillus wynnii]
MADIIVLRGSYNNLVGGIPVTTISNYGDTNGEDLYGKDIASCISYLLEEGLTLQFQSADSSGYTVMFIRPDPVPQSPIVTLLQSRVGTVVTLLTDAGAVTGTLLPLGTDVAQLLEESGDTVLVMFIQINGVI